jgi:phosphatidate phosphatase PAH1
MKQQGKGKYHIALHYNPIVKLCSSRLSMSHHSESSMQEFQHILKILQSRINKKLNSNLIIVKIKNAIEVHLNARDVKKEVIITFEIKERVGVPIAFAFKEEVEMLEGIEKMQENVHISGIPKLVQKYNIKYLKYLYYHWI